MYVLQVELEEEKLQKNHKDLDYLWCREILKWHKFRWWPSIKSL